MGDLRARIVKFLRQDPVRNFEALYHVERGGEARFWYKKDTFLIELPAARKVFLDGNQDTAPPFLSHLSLPAYIIQTSASFLPLLKKNFFVKEVQLNLVYTLEEEDFLPIRDSRVHPLIPRGSPISYSVGEEKISLETFFGLFIGDSLASYGGTQFETEEWAEIAWLKTEDAYKRRGYGSKVVSAIVEDLLRAGKRPIYRATADNIASRRLAEKLGFHLHSEYIYVALRK